MSVISQQPQPNGEMSRGIDTHGKPQTAQEDSKENELLSPEDGTTTKKGRSLLHVPSRSSSQKHQPSPTSTGLSGATASDSRDSTDGNSKESKGSILGGHRNGSAASNHSAVDTEPTNTPVNSQPSSPAGPPAQKKKKAAGLLALFCCGVPDHANHLEPGEDEIPSHKVEKVPARPATASRRTVTPSEQASASKTQLNEKEALPQAQSSSESAKPKRVSAATTQDQSTVGGDREADSKPPTVGGGAAPIVTVEPPQAAAAQSGDPTQDSSAILDDEDVDMQDAAEAVDQESKQPVAAPDDEYQKLPPPPPGPIPPVPSPPSSQLAEGGAVVPAVPEQSQQKFLLPPIAPNMKGKKCLVLDLDETLVHSSFKVCIAILFGPLVVTKWAGQILHQADFTIPVEIEGNYHNVYVIKRPGVDQFMKRVGELYEVVVFTASVSKVCLSCLRPQRLELG